MQLAALLALTPAGRASTTAISTAQQRCALALASCHTDCTILRNNLNICLCTTPKDAAQSCKNTQTAYV
ncbi:hypothetical protein EJ02DRAFT_459912 [Clathrospora elynae]|uniref:Extracellular membrane protein CFEM domain-containing protein n=1 Tax=Clathrospora elynae TaxID=706981 RepID=A0A6A5SC04_9PLEO|nr:hypothetical protein EJ02DRAFT_459912 [Clathrospora elynae]